MLAGILLDVFVTRLPLHKDRSYGSSSRETEGRTRSVLQFFMRTGREGWRENSRRKRGGKTQK